MDKKILIACPVRDRAWILPHYLEHIYNIDYPKHLISMYFIINNSSDNSYKILEDFKLKHMSEYVNIEIDRMYKPNLPIDARVKDIRDGFTYHWLCELRNKILNKCVEMKYDYLLSCDTDILVPSNIINGLIIDSKTICASLIYNGYKFSPIRMNIYNTKLPNNTYDSISLAYKYPNILKLNENDKYEHIVNYAVKNPNICDKNKIIDVDGTGAVSLIPFNACKETRYLYDVQGEDMSWSRICKLLGYRLCCKPSIYSQHIMSESLLQDYLNGQLIYANGEVIKII